MNETDRQRLDNALGVRGWRVPGGNTSRSADDVSEIPPGAPAWWLGDEDASQSFLREMGVV